MALSNIAQRAPMSERFGSYATRIFVLVLFLVLTIAMTWPLVMNLLTAVPGPPWDNFEWLYHLWWFRHSIVDLGQWPTTNPTVFYPFGYDLNLSESMWANKALMAPFLFWGNEVLAFNALLLMSFVLTGYTTYLLIAYLTDNRYAAVIGATIFTFSPYRIHAMAAGWLPLISTQWIPLAFLYLERTLREGRLRYALAAGFCLGLIALSSWYYLYIVGLFVALFVLARLWAMRRRLREAHVWRNLLAVGAVALVMIVPVAIPTLQQSAGEMRWSVNEIEKWAAGLDDFFLPNVYHPVWGDHFLGMRSYAPRYPWYVPGCIYLGLVALLLSTGAIGRGAYLRKREEKGRGEPGPARAYWLVGIISFVLALGVVLHWNGEVVHVPVPAAVENLFSRGMSSLMSKWALNKASYYEIDLIEGTIPIPLPGLLVYLFVPMANAMRTLYRFGVMTIFAVSVLAGMGAARMLGGNRPPEEVGEVGEDDAPSTQAARRGGVRSLVMAILVLVLVLADFISAPLPYGMSVVKAQPLDLWLAAQPDDVVIMQFPLMRALNGLNLYRTQYHGKRAAYGHGTFFPAAYREAMPVLSTFPSEECLDVLASWGVTHVAVGSAVYDTDFTDEKGQTWAGMRAQIEASPRLELAGITQEEPFWQDERVSTIIQGNPPIVPVLVDRVYIYELK